MSYRLSFRSAAFPILAHRGDFTEVLWPSLGGLFAANATGVGRNLRVTDRSVAMWASKHAKHSIARVAVLSTRATALPNCRLPHYIIAGYVQRGSLIIESLWPEDHENLDGVVTLHKAHLLLTASCRLPYPV